ncbi:MAG: response regulator transcription factor [Candidatus Hydrogenedentes bacterium]|nr:response regulator transcription factor [Candidatus Hydrogenedentota bacterium]
MKVLVVEDEQRILQFVKKGLEEAGFAVDSCERGDDGLLLATTQQYDAIILDIMLPGRDGLSVLRQIREKKNAVPVILLTARTALDERVEGLNLGADDYLTKPFYVEELIARLHALGRRATGQSLTVLQAGDLLVNLVTREVKNNGGDIRLTAREFTLLEYLMRSPGRVFSRTQILEHVWGYDFDPNTNLVDVHIQRLRKKLGAAGDSLIETIRGVGYRFKKSES